MSMRDFRLFAENAISAETLNEMVKLDKYKLYGDDAKKISSLLKQAKGESDSKKAKKLYQEALSNAESMKKKAQALPDDDVVDWLFNLFIKPWWWFIIDVVGTASSGESITAMSRSQAVNHYDTLIKQIKAQINALD
ncbi:MAG: hypothetical protein NC311_05815 [Muribaculaceae bacterium]|nr:hypothetical protein [Muribaculaceae bacterium]